MGAEDGLKVRQTGTEAKAETGGPKLARSARAAYVIPKL
jgi:hypothetical protein